MRKIGKPLGATTLRTERRVLVLMRAIRSGSGRLTIIKKYCKKWNVKTRAMRVYILKAEDRLRGEYDSDYQLDFSNQLAIEYKLLNRLYRDLDASEESAQKTTNTTKGNGGKKIGDISLTETKSKVSRKKLRGRVGIYAEIGKCQDRIAKLKGLHRPDLFDQGTALPDIIEISIEVNDEENDSDSDIADDGDDPDASE